MSDDVRNNTILIYGRIEHDLRNRIASREWSGDTPLPGRQRLAQYYSVALGTIERAIANLLADGTLYVIEGRGTYVAQTAQPPAMVDDLPTDTVLVPSANEPITVSQERPGNIGILLMAIDKTMAEFHRKDAWNITSIHAIEHVLSTTGRCSHLKIIDPEDVHSQEDIRAAMEEFAADAVDGVMFIDYYSAQETLAANLSFLNSAEIPTVCLTWGDAISHIPYIFFDNRYMGYQAAVHLIQSGYSRLVYLAPHHGRWVEDRYLGIRDAVCQFAGQGAELVRFHIDMPSTEQYMIAEYEAKMTTALFADPPYPLRAESSSQMATTGLITSNDFMARSVLTSARLMGLMPGRDFGIVGFDDEAFSREIGLTSLRPPLEHMVEEGLQLLNRIAQGKHVPVQMRMRADLIPRASSFRR